jgi:hypothetical protein
MSESLNELAKFKARLTYLLGEQASGQHRTKRALTKGANREIDAWRRRESSPTQFGRQLRAPGLDERQFDLVASHRPETRNTV